MSQEDRDQRTLPTGLPQEAVDAAIDEMELKIGRIYGLTERIIAWWLTTNIEGVIVFQDGGLYSAVRVEIEQGNYYFFGVACWQDRYLPVFKQAGDPGTIYLVDTENIPKFV